MKTTDNHLIHTLLDCAITCTRCASVCIDEKKSKQLSHCIELDIDCAGICNTVATFAARNSAYAKELLDECITICHACADECEKHPEVEYCNQCAAVCNECVRECEEILMAA